MWKPASMMHDGRGSPQCADRRKRAVCRNVECRSGAATRSRSVLGCGYPQILLGFLRSPNRITSLRIFLGKTVNVLPAVVVRVTAK